MHFQAQGFPSYPITNALKEEECKFHIFDEMVHVDDIPDNANVVSSHVFSKVKTNDENSLKMKARIAPHGNHDHQKNELKTDSAACPPIGIRMILSLPAIFQWGLAKTYFKNGFLQTVKVLRDVYLIPPKESSDKNHLWLLLTAAYGLVHANAKWQALSDNILSSYGFKQLRYVTQLVYLQDSNGRLIALAVKVVDDVLFAGEQFVLRSVIDKIQLRYKLGTVFYGPGLFYSMACKLRRTVILPLLFMVTMLSIPIL